MMWWECWRTRHGKRKFSTWDFATLENIEKDHFGTRGEEEEFRIGDTDTDAARWDIRICTHATPPETRLLTLARLTDKKCPFTGQVSIRGRILTGTVVSTKMHRTLIIRREYLHFIPKYARYEKRHKNLAAHVSPAFRVEEGDQVTVGQCRPLSKTVCSDLPPTISRTMKWYGTWLLTWPPGPLQRPACPSPHRQGCQEVLQVLNRLIGIYGVTAVWVIHFIPDGRSSGKTASTMIVL